LGHFVEPARRQGRPAGGRGRVLGQSAVKHLGRGRQPNHKSGPLHRRAVHLAENGPAAGGKDYLFFPQ
jgi:hypothetical protein